MVSVRSLRGRKNKIHKFAKNISLMIQSMTGYGKAELNLTNANFTIEVRSLNSKQIDANVKMSSI